MWYYAHVCKSTLKVADIIKIIPHLQVQTYITFFFQPPPPHQCSCFRSFWQASRRTRQHNKRSYNWDDCSNQCKQRLGYMAVSSYRNNWKSSSKVPADKSIHLIHSCHRESKRYIRTLFIIRLLNDQLVWPWLSLKQTPTSRLISIQPYNLHYPAVFLFARSLNSPIYYSIAYIYSTYTSLYRTIDNVSRKNTVATSKQFKHSLKLQY